MLLHGFPYDPRSYDRVRDELAVAGARVLVPYLRGYGPTRFHDDATPRSGQQAAIGHDAAELVEALGLRSPILVGFDWGGRAACIAAALWPERVGGLVAIGGDEIQDIAGFAEPEPPLTESRAWYQYYLHGERGRRCLTRYRRDLTAQLWREWAPGRPFREADFEVTAAAFANPDFVDIVVHSYRHRYGLAPGDPAYDEIEAALARRPTITVPTIVLDPTEDPMVEPRGRAEHEARFPALVDHRLVASGHDLPRHEPAAVAAAVLDLHVRLDADPVR
ncbi:MAG: alpha/beta fold hydrolase [Actinobacteria bacterium]|nr:alpha/beta fold hydrolase [Actinomycetota bacterium]